MKTALVFIWLYAVSTVFAAAGIIVHNPAETAGRQLVRVGIPFPRGKYTDASKFAVSSNGKLLPTQTDVLARHSDGSLRWISAVFQGDLDGRKFQEFKLTGNAAAPAAKKNIVISRGSQDIICDTGKMRFMVKEKKFFFAPENGESIDFTFRTADGKKFRASKGKLDSMRITRVGKLQSSLRFEGWFGADDGENFCRYIVHIDLFAGSAKIKTSCTFIITGENDKARFAEIALEIPGRYSSGEFGGVSGDALNKYLLHYAYDKYLTGDIASPKAYSETGDGKSAPGWVKAGKTAVYMEDFKENFPCELALFHDNLVCYLWPARGVAKPGRKITEENRQYLWFCHENKILDFKAPADYLKADGHGKHYVAEAAQESCLGLAKTMHLHIDFAAPYKLSAFFTSPPAALPSKETVADSYVFGPMQIYDMKKFPREEKLLERRFALERRLAETTGPGDFGKWNYGDGHSIWRNNTNSWDNSWRTWKGYHHVSGSVPWLLALRKTGWEEYRRAIAVSRHLIDVDICHYDTPESKARSKKKYAVSGKIKGGLNDYKGLTHWHAGDRIYDYNTQTEFALVYTYITGDLRGYEVAKMWGDAAVKHFTRTWDRREGTGTASSLVDLYLATLDKRYLDIAGKFIKTVLDTQAPADELPASRWQDGALNGWANYAPGIRKYYEVTKDPAVAKAICRWADAFMNGYGDTTSTGAKLHDCIDVMAYAWMISGNEKYLRHGRWLLDNYLYLYDSDDPAKCKPFESVEYFMFERIPVFLAALSKYGRNPAPLPLEKGLPEFSYQSHGKPKLGNHTVYLLGDGKPFTVEAGVTAKDKNPVSFTLETKDGKVLCKGKITPDKARLANCRITVDPAPQGVYVLKAGKNLVSLRVRSRLKECAPAKTIYSYSGGGSYAFEVPANGLLEWKCRPNIAVYPVFAALESPDGKFTFWRFYAPRDGKEKRFRMKVTPGIWKLSGIFAPMPANLKFDRKPIKYLSPSREKFFDPDRVKGSGTADAKAVFSNVPYKNFNKSRRSIKGEKRCSETPRKNASSL